MTSTGHDSLKTRRTLTVAGSDYDYYSIEAAGQALGIDFAKLPISMKVLLENMLRFEDGRSVTTDDIKAFGGWLQGGRDPAMMIGDPDGLAPACLERAELRWSLSPLTLPHGLVRVLVAEQLYRAWTVTTGHPYHRA